MFQRYAKWSRSSPIVVIDNDNLPCTLTDGRTASVLTGRGPGRRWAGLAQLCPVCLGWPRNRVDGDGDRRRICPTTCLLATIRQPFNRHIKTADHQYSNTVIGTLAVDGWAVGCYIWYSEEGLGQATAPPSPLIAVPNVTAHPSTAKLPSSYYSMWHCNCL